MSQQALKLILPLTFLSIFYVVPFFKKDGRKIALRNYPYAKIIIISTVWVLVTTALPFYNSETNLRPTDSKFLLLLIEQFIFIFAITLPFDVRDLRYDIAAKVKTIPSKIGVKKTIILAEVLLSVFIILKYYQFNLGHITNAQFITTSIAGVLTGILISLTSTKRPELFFSGLVESTMVILYMSVLVFEY